MTELLNQTSIKGYPSRIEECSPGQVAMLGAHTRFLVDLLISKGFTEDEAYQEALDKHKAFYGRFTGDSKVLGEVRIAYPLNLLEKALGLDLKALPKEEQAKVLSKIGFDTKVYPWYIEKLIYKGTKPSEFDYGEVVWGTERHDNAWCNLRIEGRSVASYEAQQQNSKRKFGESFVLSYLKG